MERPHAHILHRSTREAQVSTKPVWHFTSSAGTSPYQCGDLISVGGLQPCSNRDLGKYKPLSTILAQGLPSFQQEYKEVVLLGQAGSHGLDSCIAVAPGDTLLALNSTLARPKWAVTRTRVDKPLRLVLDAQYSNYPRCCDAVDRHQGLDTTGRGEMKPWTNQALHKLDSGKFAGMPYYTMAPKPGTCTMKRRCPFVVEVSGAAGTPWLLIQAHCHKCFEELGAYLLAVTNVSSVDKSFVNRRFVPLVKDFLRRKSYLDIKRTYLVSASRGNEIALYAALAHPHLFSLVAMSGVFKINDDIKELMARPATMGNVRRTRLSSIQFHLGDKDMNHADENFFSSVQAGFSKYPINGPQVEVRVYPESEHPTWYATWNALHEVIWSGTRKLAELDGKLLTTCEIGRAHV